MSKRKEQVPAQNREDPDTGGSALSEETLESVAGGVKSPGGCIPPIITEPESPTYPDPTDIGTL